MSWFWENFGVNPNEPFHTQHYGIWHIDNKRFCKSSVRKRVQYQIAEFCCHGKFWVEVLAWRKSECNKFRYYVTFKVRKFEWLFYKVNTFLQKTITCIGLQAEQIFSANIWCTFFFNFVPGFSSSFSMYFPKAPASCGKNILK